MRPLIIIATAMLALAACGSATQSTTSSAAGARPQAATTTTASTNGGAATATAVTGSASPAAAGAVPASVAHPASPSRQAAPWFTARVLPCVTPNGMQTLDGTTRPGYSVSFNTTYADGRHGDTHGGAGIVSPDSSGAFHTGWRVSAGTPLGSVHMLAGTGGRGASPEVAEIVFTVASTC
ncbi:MAG TPA: hypothetical protein VGQ42_06445 [Candidatus Dormibacteraeota bacterium]|jgi:hypothetical protein|nr:hypothetical protein [Candidatus Dormibacteraeota bacterium]